MASLNFETNLPNILPENSNADLGLFLDFGNVWGVITIAQLMRVMRYDQALEYL